jgi:hypothetical protein
MQKMYVSISPSRSSENSLSTNISNLKFTMYKKHEMLNMGS